MKQKTGDRWVIDKTSIIINFASYCKSNRTGYYGCPYACTMCSIRVEQVNPIVWNWSSIGFVLLVHAVCTMLMLMYGFFCQFSNTFDTFLPCVGQKRVIDW